MNKHDIEVQKALLSSEKGIIDKLKEIYNTALGDIDNKIAMLLGRTDAENLQSIVYQVDYQKALKKQINAILDEMNASQFTAISDYLTKCYENGYMGAMYSIHKQGIPIIAPINQKLVVKALQLDSKLSKSLYTSLGENIDVLKKKVRTQISRGFANNYSYGKIAQELAAQTNIGLNKSIRIARTEGHRIQEESSLDASYKAKEKGADVVKQWNASRDSRTRPLHRKLDGQIKELDELFEVNGFKAKHPGAFGVPHMDINCRCNILTRAKWELDEDELQELQDRAAYFGLDKTEDFEDFKKKYLNAMEENSIIIDEKTPCLRRLSDGKIVNTSVTRISPSKSGFKDWEFDWTKPEENGYKVFGIKVDGDDRIQGLVATKPDFRDYKAVLVDIVESAPFNNPHNKLNKVKEYAGVGGHLFAEAVKQSYEYGFDGVVIFRAKTKLVEYYMKELGAVLVNPSDRTMMIDERSAKKLYDRYYKGT